MIDNSIRATGVIIIIMVVQCAAPILTNNFYIRHSFHVTISTILVRQNSAKNVNKIHMIEKERTNKLTIKIRSTFEARINHRSDAKRDGTNA